jgi:hypothetical protein
MGRIFKRGKVTTYGKKTLFSRVKDQPPQERIMGIDKKNMQHMQKKLEKAMSLCSEASVDATYIARFDETAAQRIVKIAKNIQVISRELHQEFKSKAPMELWEDGKDDPEKKQGATGRKKKGGI